MVVNLVHSEEHSKAEHSASSLQQVDNYFLQADRILNYLGTYVKSAGIRMAQRRKNYGILRFRWQALSLGFLGLLVLVKWLEKRQVETVLKDKKVI